MKKAVILVPIFLAILSASTLASPLVWTRQTTFVSDYWNRTGTTLFPYFSGDDINTTGNATASWFNGKLNAINIRNEHWVNESGDTMTGDLIVNASTNITNSLIANNDRFQVGTSVTYTDRVDIGNVQTSSDGLLYLENRNIDTLYSYKGTSLDLRFTKANTDHNDYILGNTMYMLINNNSFESSTLVGNDIHIQQSSGSIGDAVYNRDMKAIQGKLNLDNGNVTRDIYGNSWMIDQELSHKVNNNIYGIWIWQDYDGTTDGSTYGIYMHEHSGQD